MDLDQSTLPTATPSAALDVAADGGWDWLGGGLSKALDAYVTLDMAHLQANQFPQAGAPGGYYRVPGTGQVVPAGTIAPGAGITPGMILMGVAALLLVVIVVKKL